MARQEFAPLATGPNFGSSDFIGSLRGQSEMTLNGMSSGPHNGVKSLDLILMRLMRQAKFCLQVVKCYSKGSHVKSHLYLGSA